MAYDGVRRTLFCALVTAAMMTVTAVGSMTASGEEATQPPQSDAVRQWTVAMYWASDNNLDEYTDYFVSLWIEHLINTADVALCVFLDRLELPANISTVTEDGWVEQKDLGEVNSSSPDTLASFIEFALTDPSLASENFMLMVQDHGNGYLGLCTDEGLPDSELPEAWMSIDDLGKGIREGAAAAEKTIDIIALDACTMGTVEVAYELKGAASYLVASELGVPFDGMNYMALLDGLSAYPFITPRDLACKLVDDYALWYSAPLGTYPTLYPYMQDFASLSVIDLNALDPLVEAFAAFAESVTPKDNALGKYLKTAATHADPSLWLNNMGVWFYPDIKVMFTSLSENLTGEYKDVADACDAVVAAADAAIVHDWASWRMRGLATGLSVFVCPSLGVFQVYWDLFGRAYDGVGLDFVDDSGWDDVLKMYFYTVKQYGNPPPVHRAK